MISYETMNGTVCFSTEYLEKLIGAAVQNCYGVVKMVPSRKQKIFNIFKRDGYLEQGIAVRGNISTVNVDLHIAVIYGVNINTIANSITEAVKYTVKKATGINVSKVTVRIDGIITE